MTSISLGAHQPSSHWNAASHIHLHSPESPSYDTRMNPPSSPLPNPPFSFPAQAPSSTDTSRVPSGIPSNNMSSSSRRGRRQPPASLPSFSFPQAPPEPVSSTSPTTAAAAAGSAPTTKSIPTAPASPVLVEPAHLNAKGHRRQPSEFLGDASSQVVISSSKATASTLPHPGPGLTTGPGRGARRHAHRRSQAISSVDLTAVAKAFPPVPVSGSVPTSPILPFANDKNSKLSSRSFPEMHTAQTSPQRAEQQQQQQKLQVSPTRRPYKEESITTAPTTTASEVAPVSCRPLSTISSESSVSTVRPNQIFSDRSGSGQRSGASSPLHNSNEATARPKTAGAQLAMKWKPFGPSSDNNEHTKRPLSASASMALNFSLGNVGRSQDADRTASNSSSSTTNAQAAAPSDQDMEDAETSTLTQRTAHERKPSKKEKKKRSWAGILIRKGKKRSSKKSRKSPTPPPMLTRTNSELGSMYSVDFDHDNTIVIRTPTAQNAPRSHPQSGEPATSTDNSLEKAWKPKSFYEQQSNPDIFSPVIDLDAALGPFNTPEMGAERNITSGFMIASKRMYSGGRRGEFVGPEMRYHRRAESAPEMPPFDRSFLGASRFGLSTAMENPDVFDEEEEDAFLAQNDDQANQKNAESSEADDDAAENGSSSSSEEEEEDEEDSDVEEAGLGIQVVDSSNLPDLYPASVESRPSTAQVITPRTPYAHAIDFESQSQRSNSNSTTYHHPGSIGIVGSDSGQASPRNFDEKRPSTSPEFIYNISNATNLTPIPAIIPPVPMIPQAFPSPAPSSTSFDVPRLNTASSSMTDRHHSSGSVYSGEPGSDYLQNSSEDVPSLTSSASTMTGNIPRLPSAIYGRIPGDRAASFSHVLQLNSAANSASSNGHSNNNRPSSSKRASLVSFSRLVGANSERSKLSHEEKAPMDESEKRKKKGLRITRLMQFWKVKDKR
ncbi:TPA_exp: putative Cell wall proline rich protein [Trichophyton benhamiae CBS 112371]|nr:TPA_exp: putative Cell wall proline rich protein [Trichophyton benhamiae CBS 112371]